jgi:hypothetical protein
VVLFEAGREPPGQLADFNLLFSLIAGAIAVVCIVALFWDAIPGRTGRRKKKKKKRRRPILLAENED